MTGNGRADGVATYGGGAIGIIIANIHVVNDLLQFVLLSLSITVMVWKFIHDLRKRKTR